MRLPRPYFSNVAAMGGGTDPAATAFFAAVVGAGGSVSAPRRVIYNTLFAGLRNGGFLTSLDRLWIYMAENSQTALIDLINLQTCSLVSAPTFTADQGYTGNGTSSYINSGVAPSGCVKFTLNAAMVGGATLSARNAGADAALIGTTSGANQTQIFPWFTDNNTYINISDEGTGTGVAHPLSTVKGLYAAVRSDASTTLTFVNNNQVNTTATAPVEALASQNFLFGARDNGSGTKQSFSTDIISVGFVGNIQAANIAAFGTALNTYATAVGNAFF